MVSVERDLHYGPGASPVPGAVTGWGTALPPTVITNDDLALRLDTSDAWISERTGIRARHIGGSTTDLATRACRQAMERAMVEPSDIDLLVLATTTPDVTIPATAAIVHDDLGLQCPAFDLNAASAGYVYALVAAHGFLAIGYRRILLVGAETLSRVTDPTDRSTAVLLADGAGAVVLEQSSDPHLLAWDLGLDSRRRDILTCEIGGSLRMRGSEVFREAVLAATGSIARVLARAEIDIGRVSLFVPHQANLRIIEAIAERAGLDMGTAAIVLDRTGNTSAASIPLALAEAADQERIGPGDLVLLTGFGAGLTWGTALLRWRRDRRGEHRHGAAIERLRPST